MERSKIFNLTIIGVMGACLGGCMIAPKNPEVYSQEPALPVNIERGDFPIQQEPELRIPEDSDPEDA